MKNTELIVAIDSLLMDSSHQMDKMETLAQAYADACQALNSALVRCIGVLREGNSVEAIRLAHSEHVLEDYDTLVLEFTNRDLWLEVVKTFTEVRVPVISEELADELDVCEKKVEDQKDLLRRHRLLAYSNAPMFKRIQVLRRLCARNPKYFEWQKDLEEYIQCYYDQLSQEVPKVTKLSAIKQIEDEINSVAKISNEIPTLSAIPPAILVSTLQSRKEKLTNEDLQKRRNILFEDMKKITAVLVASFQQKQFKAGEEAFNFWYVCVDKLKQLNGVPPQDLQKKAAEPLQWIHNEKARMLAENEYFKQRMLFERSVGTDAVPLDTVQKNYMKLESAARNANISVPVNLTDAMRKREKRWNRRRFRKKVFRIFMTLIILAGLGTAGYFGWQAWLQNQVVANIEQQLTDRKDRAEVKSNYKDAMAYVERIEKDFPEEAQKPSIQKLITQIRDGDSQNRSRLEEYEKLFNSLNEQIVVNYSFDPGVKKELSQLQKLVRTKEERAQYDNLAGQYLENQKNAVNSQNKRFMTEAEALQNKIKDLNVNSADAVREFQAIDSQIDELRKWPEQISETLKNQRISDLTKALARKREDYQAHQKNVDLQANYAKAFEELISGSIDIPGYTKSLKKYKDFVKANPGVDPRISADEIEKRLREEGLWKRIEEWNKFMSNYGSVMNDDHVTPESARSFLTEWSESGEALLVDKDQPWNQLLLSKIQALQKMAAKRNDSSISRKTQELLDYCDMVTVRKYWYAKNNKTKTWFYFVSNEDSKPMYVTRWEQTQGEKPADKIHKEDLIPSPHVKLCRNLASTIRNLGDNFEEEAVGMLEQILREYYDGANGTTTRELDPLFAWTLLTMFTETFSECNEDFKNAFKPMLDLCKRHENSGEGKLTVIKVNPLNPDDVSRNQRDKAVRILEDIHDEHLFEKCEAELTSKNKISEGQCAGIYRLVGFLAYDGKRVTIHPVLKNSSVSGPLWVCRENSDLDTEIEFLEIGKIKKGVISTNYTTKDPEKFQYAPVFVFEYVK